VLCINCALRISSVLGAGVVCSAQCYGVVYAVYIVECGLRAACTVYPVFCVLRTVLCTVYCVLCTVLCTAYCVLRPAHTALLYCVLCTALCT
jgi:hypothetical protein